MSKELPQKPNYMFTWDCVSITHVNKLKPMSRNHYYKSIMLIK